MLDLTFLLIIFLINLIVYLLYKKKFKMDTKDFSINKKILIPLIILVLFFWFLNIPLKIWRIFTGKFNSYFYFKTKILILFLYI